MLLILVQTMSEQKQPGMTSSWSSCTMRPPFQARRHCCMKTTRNINLTQSCEMVTHLKAWHEQCHTTLSHTRRVC